MSGLNGHRNVPAERATAKIEAITEVVNSHRPVRGSMTPRITSTADPLLNLQIGMGLPSISISPGIGSVGQEWMRQCELVAEARALLS